MMMMMMWENIDPLLQKPRAKVPISKRNQLRTFAGNLIKQQQEEYLWRKTEYTNNPSTNASIDGHFGGETKSSVLRDGQTDTC